ncbi:MAG: ABC transporter permease [Dehalococcoidia bacterium]|nr:MAG: ABC transporter permease [Dehalococcoidia bacterium]
MQRYLIRRLLWLIVNIWMMVTLLFFLMYVIPGDVAMVMLGEEGGTIDPVQYELLRERLGLNRPLHVQYGEWIWNALQGDLGRSYWTGAPVVQEMGIRFPYTMGLTVVGMFWVTIIAIPVGVISALNRETLIDYGLRGFQITFLAAPGFWIAILVLSFLAVNFRWHPRIEYATLWSDPVTAFQQYALPGFILGLHSSANNARMLRSSMLEILGSDFVRTARAKGLKERTVVYVHTMRNAFLPVLELFGSDVQMLISGTIVMEMVFNIPGLGTLMISAVNARDIPLVTGIAVYIGLVIIGVNLLLDILYAFVDPRIHYD